MSWITIIWSILIGACAAVALPNLIVGLWQRHAARLFFFGVAVATIAQAALELKLMHSTSAAEYGATLRWFGPPIFVIVVSIVGFVRLYFGVGRLWLGITTCLVRFACLVINFISPVNLTFTEMTGLQRVPFLDETVAVGTGVVTPWVHLAELGSILMVVFVVDASMSLWRKGNRRDRQRAVTLGGSLVFEVYAAQLVVVLARQGIISAPYPVSLWFFAIVAAMAFELSYDFFAAGQVAQKLHASEESLVETETRFGRMADAAPVMIWMAGPDKLCTFFNKAWFEFTGRTMEQELGQGWTEGVHPDDLAGCLKTYVERFDARESFFMKYRLRRRDGEYRYITDTGVPRYGSKGKFRGYIGACSDVTDTLEKERALRESEERMSLATNAAGLIVWTWDISRDEVWLSPKDRAFFGFSQEEKLTAARIRNVVHPDDRQFVSQLVEKSLASEKELEADFRIVLPGDRVCWVHRRGRMEFDGNKKPICERGVLMDITERKQAERKFRLVVEASPSGIVLADEEGKIVLVNTQTEKLFGYRRDELIGKPVEVLVPKRFAGRHPRHRATFFCAPETRAMGAGRDLFGCRKDGSEFPVEIGLSPIQTPQEFLVLANIVDITERKQAEEKFRLAVEASPSGIVLVNKEGNIALVNTQTERMFGYHRDELIGEPVEMLLPERFAGGHSAYRANFLAAPEARAMGAGRELFARRKDGSEFPVEIGLNPIQMAGGLLILANVVDISARLATEEQTRRSREQVELLSRVSLLGEMTASLAHELNQPLTAITNNANAAMQYIEQGRLDPKQLKEILTDVTADGRRAFNIVHDVRSAIKKGTAIRGKINLNDVVKSVSHLVQPDAVAKFCKMEISLAPDLPGIEADPTQIQQVLINLVNNAFDAMAETSVSRRIVQITTGSNGDDTVSVAVRDHGYGVAETARVRLFEHFFTTKKEGLGMGLAIVRSIVEAHGGTIAVENASGGGARFQVRLPVKERSQK